MSALVQSISQTKSQITAIAFAALLGFSIMYVAGHAQSAVLHDAAHDVRHATGFPCH